MEKGGGATRRTERTAPVFEGGAPEEGEHGDRDGGEVGRVVAAEGEHSGHGEEVEDEEEENDDVEDGPEPVHETLGDHLKLRDAFDDFCDAKEPQEPHERHVNVDAEGEARHHDDEVEVVPAGARVSEVEGRGRCANAPLPLGTDEKDPRPSPLGHHFENDLERKDAEDGVIDGEHDRVLRVLFVGLHPDDHSRGHDAENHEVPEVDVVRELPAAERDAVRYRRRRIPARVDPVGVVLPLPARPVAAAVRLGGGEVPGKVR